MTEFHKSLVAEISLLKAFARRLCRGAAWSDDLVQDTLITALRKEGDFTQGTNLQAWLFTIMKNAYRNEARKIIRREKVFLQEEDSNHIGIALFNQEDGLALGQVLTKIDSLPGTQRDVLALVAIKGLTYAETAKVLKVPVGTIRSRLARARLALNRNETEKTK